MYPFVNRNDKVTIATGTQQVDVQGYRCVRVIFQGEAQDVVLTLHNVAYVPHLAYGLFS